MMSELTTREGERSSPGPAPSYPDTQKENTISPVPIMKPPPEGPNEEPPKKKAKIDGLVEIENEDDLKTLIKALNANVLACTRSQDQAVADLKIEVGNAKTELQRSVSTSEQKITADLSKTKNAIFKGVDDKLEKFVADHNERLTAEMIAEQNTIIEDIKKSQGMNRQR